MDALSDAPLGKMKLDQRLVIGHDAISSSVSSSDSTNELSPLFSQQPPTPTLSQRDRPTFPQPVIASKSIAPEFTSRSPPRPAPAHEDGRAVLQPGVSAARDADIVRMQTSFETPGCKLDRLISHHHRSRRKWESPCPPGESTDRAWAPSLGGSLPVVAEQSVDSTANIWRSPFSQPFAATANAPMEPHVARAEALAMPRPRGSGSHSTAPAAASSWP
jgi:hypothetical protein